MYTALNIAFLLLGVIFIALPRPLYVMVKKLGGAKNPVPPRVVLIGTRMLGSVLFVVGAWGLFNIFSGRLTLPL